jgi:hypothetical protein
MEYYLPKPVGLKELRANLLDILKKKKEAEWACSRALSSGGSCWSSAFMPPHRKKKSA